MKRYRLKSEIKERLKNWITQESFPFGDIDSECDASEWEKCGFYPKSIEPVENRIILHERIYLPDGKSLKLRFNKDISQIEQTFSDINAFFNGELFTKEDMKDFGIHTYSNISPAL